MLADNVLLMKKNYPELYQFLVDEKAKNNQNEYLVEETKNKSITIKYENSNQVIYLHSKYNPQQEATVIIDQLEISETNSRNNHVIFFGLGLGYQVENFISRYPLISYSIIEPSEEIFIKFLENRLFKKIVNRNLMYLTVGNNYQALFQGISQHYQKNLIICELPVYKQIFDNDYSVFLNYMKQVLKSERSSLRINYAFKERWIINSVNNFKYVINTPNILMEHNGAFEDKTVILVAAGPSLDYEIENLKRIRGEGLAYIFSVGSAINTLITQGILPHAMCTYDPEAFNQNAFVKLKEEDIDSIPMIFGSSVGYETLEQYPGAKYHMITTQDTISDFLLKSRDAKQIEKVNDAPSIAVVTMELLIKLGVSRVILVGQNLGYQRDQHYASGVSYMPDKAKDTIIIKDVDGNDIETTESFLNMKYSLENIIGRSQIEVINTTVGGAQINGTEFKKLDQLFDSVLTKNQVENDIFEGITSHNIYDREYLCQQYDSLDKNYLEFTSLLSSIRRSLNNLREQLQVRNSEKVEKTHLMLDAEILKLEMNEFFKVIAIQMNRVERDLLIMQINHFRSEKNVLKKAEGILNPTEALIIRLIAQRSLNDEIISNLKKSIIEKK
jgi:Uncharacterized protein conserved in bacteria